MTPPSVDTLFRSLRAAIEEVCNLKELLMEMDNRSTGIELKYKDLANKVRYLERCSMDATESLHRATQRNKGLTAALKSTVLDIWVGHCNNCGNKFDYDDETNSPHILEKCGAVSESNTTSMKLLIDSAVVSQLYPKETKSVYAP